MKGCRCFLGIFFLVLIAVSQSVAADNIIPSGLKNAIESVKKMKRSGASKKDIATFVTRTVANRLTFLNHKVHQKDGSLLVNNEIEKKVKKFNAWRNKGAMVDVTFSSAIWAWENRMGQCNESASVTFHIFAMAFESTDEIIIVRKNAALIVGDHAFVVLGDDVKNIPGILSPDDLLKLDDSYIIDPWGGKSFSTKDLSRFDIYQHGTGVVFGKTEYKFYKQQYDKWLSWCKKYPDKYQKWLNGTPDTAAEKAKDRKEMNRLLAQYRKDIDELWALRDQILETGKDNYAKAATDLKLAKNKLSEIEKYKEAIFDYVDEGKRLCDGVMPLYQKILDLSVAMEDGEVLINKKIDLAKALAANCKTDANGVFISNNYQAAQDAYTIMIKAKDGALEAFNDIDKKLYRIKTINDNLKNIHDRYAWRDIKQECRELIENKPKYLEQLKTGLKNEKEFTKKVQALKQKIEASQQNYVPYFSSSRQNFEKLVRDITNNTKLDYATAISDLDDLFKDYQKAQTALDTPRADNPLFSGDPPLTECNAAKTTKTVMDKIDESFLRGLLVLKTSDYLRDGCQVKVEPPEGGDESPPDSPPQPPDVDTGEVEADISSGDCTGGLIITGPNKIDVDQGVSYTARDKAGNPYPPGSISWSYSNKSIASLYNSGNPITGVGFKAGTIVIKAQCGTYIAYLDVEISDLAQAKKLCNEAKKAATDLSVKIQDNEKKFISFENKLKKLFEKFKDLKKENNLIKTAHKDLEKKTAAIAETSDELEKLALKICNATNELNDHTKADFDHNRNYDWINNKKERLKELLDSAKNIIKNADSLDTDSKKRLEAAKLLKDSSQAALQEMSYDIKLLLETNFDESMNSLNKKTAMISTDSCPEDVFIKLREITEYYQKNQNKLEQIIAFYKTIKTDFDKKIEEVENLEQVYQKTEYLLNLSKAYVERADTAAVKGAFCTVLADGIMERVFIPDVRGIAIGNAESMVSRKGLNVTRSELGPPPSIGETGIVKKLTPGITKRVKKGTMVTLSHYDERPDKDTQLANTDCSRWPGSQPVWDTQMDKPACGCTGDLEWNQDKTKCISRIDAALANANCQYPNSYPVWNSNRQQVMCECLPGTAWNNDKSACINSKQAALEKMDCSQYPGTIPIYDNNGNLGCKCPGGLPWLQYLNRCATQRDVALASVDCSQFPGTVPGWDTQKNQAVCNCPSGTEWDSRMGKCINKKDLAMANTDCSHLPGSAPLWSYINNRVECECQSPFSRDPMTGNCVDFQAQLEQGNREFYQEMENNQRKFEQEMAELQDRGQKQLQQNQSYWANTINGMVKKPSRPSTPTRNTGHTYQTQQNKCGRKISRQELVNLRENFKRMVKQWSHVQGWNENFRISVGADRYIGVDRYQKNVGLWENKVNCWNGCAMAAPKSGATSADIKRFYNCRQKCFKDYKDDKT